MNICKNKKTSFHGVIFVHVLVFFFVVYSSALRASWTGHMSSFTILASWLTQPQCSPRSTGVMLAVVGFLLERTATLVATLATHARSARCSYSDIHTLTYARGVTPPPGGLGPGMLGSVWRLAPVGAWPCQDHTLLIKSTCIITIKR